MLRDAAAAIYWRWATCMRASGFAFGLLRYAESGIARRTDTVGLALLTVLSAAGGPLARVGGPAYAGVVRPPNVPGTVVAEVLAA